MNKTEIIVHPDYVIGEIDKRLYGSFLEHIGRAIYGGIYEPEHPTADENGFRQDVAALIRELGVSAIRYPGGNFVSGYNWEDGVGPRESRPLRKELAWGCTEPNLVGTDDFCAYCRRMDIDPIMAINLGTRGADDARNLVEYCNSEAGTLYADRRVANGYTQPHNIRMWCLGNEMDGDWQIGHKTAAEYGRLAHEAAKVMRMVDPGIELVLCGSSNSIIASFPQWEATVLDEAYDSVDYISMHSYYENSDGDTDSFVACNADMERFIHGVTAACDYVKTKKRSSKTMMISYDEWNVWYQFSRIRPYERWSVAPPLFEDVYNMEDALALGGMLITLLRHCDRVKIACLAQLVNVIAPITTALNGPVWKQTTYYPFLHASRYGRGKVLHTVGNAPQYECKRFGAVPTVESVCVLNPDGTLTVFACNRNQHEAAELEITLYASGYRAGEHIVMSHANRLATNTRESPERVIPIVCNDMVIEDGCYKVKLPPFSWNVLRLYKQEELS